MEETTILEPMCNKKTTKVTYQNGKNCNQEGLWSRNILPKVVNLNL
jgi:hypothetical protein